MECNCGDQSPDPAVVTWDTLPTTVSPIMKTWRHIAKTWLEGLEDTIEEAVK
jgi:hypothetical protein